MARFYQRNVSVMLPDTHAPVVSGLSHVRHVFAMWRTDAFAIPLLVACPRMKKHPLAVALSGALIASFAAIPALA